MNFCLNFCVNFCTYDYYNIVILILYFIQLQFLITLSINKLLFDIIINIIMKSIDKICNVLNK